MSRLYCYVDETGQDTKGKLFVVGMVMTEHADHLRIRCEAIEQISRKNRKWKNSTDERRLSYMKQIIEMPMLNGKLMYSIYRNTTDYVGSTIDALAQMASDPQRQNQKLGIYLDALPKTRKREYGTLLRQKGVRQFDLHGVAKEESDACLRLADALAGFVRDAIEQQTDELHNLFKVAVSKGILVKK